MTAPCKDMKVMCFAGNNDLSCHECEKQWEKEKAKSLPSPHDEWLREKVREKLAMMFAAASYTSWSIADRDLCFVFADKAISLIQKEGYERGYYSAQAANIGKIISLLKDISDLKETIKILEQEVIKNAH